jgi:hypothetical protein
VERGPRPKKVVGNRKELINAREMKKTIPTKELRQLAVDVLDGKVFTSRHVFVAAEGDPDKYVKLMKSCFLPEAFISSVKELKDLLANDLFNGVLFYEYLTENRCPNPDVLPIFHTAKLLCGKNYEKFDRILSKEYKSRLN